MSDSIIDSISQHLVSYFLPPISHTTTLSHRLLKHYIERSYWIWVVGEPTSTGSWKQQLDGKRAQTDFTLLGRQDGISHLNVTLQTGRTHQIRRHAQMNGYPIIGDRKYGGAATIAVPMV